MPAIENKEAPRKLAPNAVVVKPYIDDRVRLVEKAKKQLGKKAEGMTFFYGDKNIADTGRYADEGYVATGFNHRGDPLFMRPKEALEQHIADAADQSASQYQMAKTASDDKYRTRSADGDTIGPEQEQE